jgi:hypothetical protein
MLVRHKTSLVSLAVTAVLLSRSVFALIDDPEGPYIPIVAGLSAVIFLVSLAAYVAIGRSPLREFGRVATIVAQVAVAGAVDLILR